MRGAFLHSCCYATKKFSVFLDNGFGIFVFTRKVFTREFKVKADDGECEREEDDATRVVGLIHSQDVTF